MDKVSQDLKEGIAAHKEGSLPQAEAAYRRVLEADPNNADANHNMGLLARQVGKHIQANNFFERAHDAQPDNIAYLRSLVELLLFQDRLGEVSELLDSQKHNSSAKNYISTVRDRLKAYQAVANLNKKDILRILSEAYEQKNVDRIINYSEGLLRNDNDHEVLNYLGAAYILKRAFKQAIGTLEKGQKLFPGDKNIRQNLGLAYLESGQPKLAVATLEDPELKLLPGSPYLLGRAYLECRQPDLAIVNLENALRNDNSNCLVWFSLAAANYMLGNGETSLELIVQAETLNADRQSEQGRTITTAHLLLVKAQTMGMLSRISDFEKMAVDRRKSEQVYTSSVNFDDGLVDSLYNVNLSAMSATNDARYGNGVVSDFRLFDNKDSSISAVASNLSTVIERTLDGEILQSESFLNILRSGGGTTPHHHLGSHDVNFNLGLHKYSLTFYIRAGDLEAKNPGVLEFPELQRSILPYDGLCVLFPSNILHNAIYDGAEDRIMIGMNFYLV